MRNLRCKVLVLAALAVFCMGGTCRQETAQTVTTTFLEELALAAADALIAAASDR